MGEKKPDSAFDADVLVIGGGINGAGIARDAVGRGLSVILCDKGDLAGGTSSASTKLIHGGLRYLEHYEFGLVRSALSEREVLLSNAPHIIWPLRFILPQSPGVRPAWLIRLGLFLYDHLGKRKRLPGSGAISLKNTPQGRPLKPELTKAAYYSDCWVDDARLVVLNAIDASERGAKILTRTECVCAEPAGSGWRATLADRRTGDEIDIRARLVVNAAGPWAEKCLTDVIEGAHVTPLRLVRGSHIIVPKMFDHDDAYIFQNPDKRIVFAIPYERDFTMIGTTDEDFDGSLDDVQASEREIEYLIETANRFFNERVSGNAIVRSFSGVRPLLGGGTDDAKEVTRDYRLDLRKTTSGAPVLSVLGGKITTYRKLAEQAVEKISETLGVDGAAWTASAPLPGGDVADGDIDEFARTFAEQHPWLPENLRQHYVHTYGTRASVLLQGARRIEDLGHHFGAGLYEREVLYLIGNEWAVTADDILWRRTKLGLHGEATMADELQRWLDARPDHENTELSSSEKAL